MDSEKFEKKPLKNHIFKTFTLSTKGGFKGEKIANNLNNIKKKYGLCADRPPCIKLDI